MNEVKELVEELRNKKSRDNRELLDRSADMIERLAKELCEKSACHHKCHDTSDCVVEDEALLLINENKSNNFDVKSNNLPFVLTNEDKVSVKDREIEEMAKAVCVNCMDEVCASGRCAFQWDCPLSMETIKKLYNAGYRKQSEWISVDKMLPEKARDYLCRCVIRDNADYPFFMVLRYILIDENPHFQHECDNGLRVSHWMPLPEAPKMKGGAE